MVEALPLDNLRRPGNKMARRATPVVSEDKMARRANPVVLVGEMARQGTLVISPRVGPTVDGLFLTP